MRYKVKTLVIHDQIALQYVEKGDFHGIPLILLHGYADSWRSFEPVLHHLHSSIHAFALTQRGHGDASRPLTGYRVSDFSLDLVDFMDRLHLNSAVITGGSSGGIIARRFTLDFPERTLGLILLGSPLTLQNKASVKVLWDSKISKLTDPVDSDFVRQFTENQLNRQIPKAFLETMIRENLKVPARVWKATLKGLMEDDSYYELDKLNTPTLIIWGEKDSIISRSEQEIMQKKIRGSRLVIYPDTGHVLYWEEPERVALDIKTFIDDL
ncbi:MAG: alpha/beta hydrolase [Dehalococcoidales bacterium]|jgi:pimeloyl-ACP methyl ester carboxylesterase|nr:alpha/beta hydrolase [Dehalococcoidales bacterium]